MMEKSLEAQACPDIQSWLRAWNDSVEIIGTADFANNYLVLVFFEYPRTNASKIILNDFKAMEARFNRQEAEIIACCVDDADAILQWKRSTDGNGLKGRAVKLLCDEEGEIARQFGVYDESTEQAYPSIFVIDGQNRVRDISIYHSLARRNAIDVSNIVQKLIAVDRDI